MSDVEQQRHPLDNPWQRPLCLSQLVIQMVVDYLKHQSLQDANI